MNLIEFADFSEINCYISNNRRRDIFNMKVPKHKDLVIRFDSSSDRRSFIDLLKQTAQESSENFAWYRFLNGTLK